MHNFCSLGPLFRAPVRAAKGISLMVLSAAISANAVAHTGIIVAETGITRTAAQWKRAAIDDIESAFAITLENHPGVYDKANPVFVKNLSLARERGLALAAKVTSSAGYSAAIQRFNVSVNDGHAGIVTTLPQSAVPPERWPGFVTTWRGDALYVFAADAGGPQAGAKVVACDGKPIRELIVKNVFAYQGRIDEPGHWWVFARNLFLDQGNPFVSVPKRCKFEESGVVVERTLMWKQSTEKMIGWRTLSYNGETLPAGLTELRPKLFWAAMPSFHPNENERDAYRKMFEEIQNHRQRYLDADAIVVDLRQNNGGSSIWSKDFASALWGKDRVERRRTMYFENTEVWWRASKDNTRFLTDLVGVLINKKETEAAEYIGKTSIGMKAAFMRGDKFFVAADTKSGNRTAGPTVDLPSDPSPYTKPLYVIVPGQCASACLDALDILTLFSNTVLIGAPSAADSTYMDLRRQPVGSGLASVIIPNKVYVNRPRASGAAYIPQIYVRDVAWSLENFVAIVDGDLKNHVERGPVFPSPP